MHTRLILIRHGDSHHKADGIVGGPRSCRGLTDAGRRQAEALGRRLAADLQTPPEAIYSSVLPRAIETAELVAAAIGLETVVQDCGLCTWRTPDYADGMPVAEFQQAHGVAGGGVYRPFEDGNESWAEMVARAGRALETIAARHAGRTVVIATHNEVVKISLIALGGISLNPSFETAISPASITEWITDGDPSTWPRPRWTLMRLNDSAHLPRES
jgi:broad specificity phosphatase PhoE